MPENPVYSSRQLCLKLDRIGKNYTHNFGYIEVSHQIPQLEVEEMSDDEVKSDQISMYLHIAYWPISVPDKLRVELIQKRSEPFQNKNGPFQKLKRQGEKYKGKCRQLTTAWFYKNLPNGKKVLNSCMVYSPSKESLFCFCCRKFP